jgi:hypothetical protein
MSNDIDKAREALADMGRPGCPEQLGDGSLYCMLHEGHEGRCNPDVQPADLYPHLRVALSEVDRLREARATAERQRDTLAARVAELEAHVGSLHKATARGRDAERAAVVEWLRGPAGYRMVPVDMPYCDDYADAIARGEHNE